MTPLELQAWQDRLGLTQVEAAAELKMSPQGYRHLLAGRRQISGQIALLCWYRETYGPRPLSNAPG
jgi:hypothetical protein